MIDVRTSPAPIETVTPIKPSEAIRLGCLTTEQAFNNLSNGDGTACVMGALYIGYGVWDGSGKGFGTLPPKHPASDAFRAVGSLPCPEGCNPSMGFGYSTGPAHLNDAHRWSRERIADWLQGLGL